MNWISVKDKLPNDASNVAVIVGERTKTVAFFFMNEWWDIHEGKMSGVRYWMPLPELPMEEESK